MLNVDAGNRPHRPENPKELRASWRLTWLAIIGLIVFVLLFVAVSRFQGSGASPDRGQQEGVQGPGERERSEPPREPQPPSQPRR
jgi:hypothetical protein